MTSDIFLKTYLTNSEFLSSYCVRICVLILNKQIIIENFKIKRRALFKRTYEYRHNLSCLELIFFDLKKPYLNIIPQFDPNNIKVTMIQNSLMILYVVEKALCNSIDDL